jgi:hypothetical protein
VSMCGLYLLRMSFDGDRDKGKSIAMVSSV